MIRRFLLVFASLVVGWLGAVHLAAAIGAPTVDVLIYDYAAHAVPAVNPAVERGPPATYDHTIYDADGKPPLSASASLGGPTTTSAVSPVERTDDTIGAPALTMTGRQGQVADGDFYAPGGASVAAKTGDELLEGEQYVYRVHGGESGPWGHSWTPENPMGMTNPRSELGLPKVNSGQMLTRAKVRSMDGVIKRDALPLDGNPGGAPEWLFPNPAGQLEHHWTIPLVPPW